MNTEGVKQLINVASVKQLLIISVMMIVFVPLADSPPVPASCTCNTTLELNDTQRVIDYNESLEGCILLKVVTSPHPDCSWHCNISQVHDCQPDFTSKAFICIRPLNLTNTNITCRNRGSLYTLRIRNRGEFKMERVLILGTVWKDVV